jgi:predicted component of type VI protein secretion system
MDPLRVQVQDLDGKGTEEYAFPRSPVRVGRGDLNDLRLDRPYVSSWHGVIQFDDEGIRFIDLGSTNGSYVNGARLERNKPADILPETELNLGRLRLVLSRGAAEGKARPPEPATCFARRVALDVSAVLSRPAGASAPSMAPAPRPASPAPPAPAPAPAPVAAPAPAPDAAVDRALEAASWQLGILHDACRQASESFRMALDGVLAPLTDPQRRAARAAIAAKYPFAVVEGAPPAPAAAVAPAIAPAPAPAIATIVPGPAPVAQLVPDALSGDALRLVRAFAEAYLSAAEAPATPAALEQFLGALAEALETAARGYLELRGGYEQFGREMGIRIPKGEGALARISEARQLVGWLLAPGEDESRSRQLAGAFADLMIHQVALLNGVQAGARAMLDELSPEALAQAAERDGRAAIPLKPLKEAGFWRTFVEHWHALADEESAVTGVLFGRAFARAYSAVAGRRTPTNSDADDARMTPRAGRKR